MEVSDRTLTLGPEGNTRIIFEAGMDSVGRNRMMDMVLDTKVVWYRGEDVTTILGRGEQGILRVVGEESERHSLLEALRGIEAYEASRECVSGMASVFAAILAAESGLSEGKMRVVGAPAFFAHIAEQRGECERSAWLEADIEREIDTFFEELVVNGRFCRPTAGPLDSARFWIKIGETLWDPNVRSRLSGLYLDETIRRILILLSGAWMDLKPEGRVKVSGTSFRLKGASKRWAWQQVLEWEAGGIGRSTLKYLTAYQTAYSFDDMISELMGTRALNQTESRSHAIEMAKESRWLLKEAAQNRACDPRGSFRVDIPDRTPLKRWEVSSLRVWILPRIGLWIALERDEKPCVSFQWMVKSPHLRRWVIQDDAIPDIHLTMSALWRDLKIGGREVILPVDEKAVVKGQSDTKKIKLQGRIQWGSEEELKRILRKAYDVEPHIRVLPRGKCVSHSAYRRARARGIRLKPGTTLVRGHQRGIPDKDVDKVPIKAQGLARLILASRGFSTMT